MLDSRVLAGTGHSLGLWCSDYGGAFEGKLML